MSFPGARSPSCENTGQRSRTRKKAVGEGWGFRSTTKARLKHMQRRGTLRAVVTPRRTHTGQSCRGWRKRRSIAASGTSWVQGSHCRRPRPRGCRLVQLASSVPRPPEYEARVARQRGRGGKGLTSRGGLNHVADGEPLDGLVLGRAARAVRAADGLDVAAALLVSAIVLPLLDHFGGVSESLVRKQKASKGLGEMSEETRTKVVLWWLVVFSIWRGKKSEGSGAGVFWRRGTFGLYPSHPHKKGRSGKPSSRAQKIPSGWDSPPFLRRRLALDFSAPCLLQPHLKICLGRQFLLSRYV